MTTQVFVSYRRKDTADVAGNIYNRLIISFGIENVFMDVDVIPVGCDFRQIIATELQKTDIFLALIGVDWLRFGNLSDRTDYVRIEIETALQRDIPVIPLLIGHRAMPTPLQLPDAISELAFRNAFTIERNERFHADVDKLISKMHDATGNPQKYDWHSGRTALEKIKSRLEEQTGNWDPSTEYFVTEPDRFRHLFMVLIEDRFVGRGAIVQGNIWDHSREPVFKTVYGYCEDKPGTSWHINLEKVAYLGNKWMPYFRKLSDIVFEDGGIPRTAFTHFEGMDQIV